MFLAVISLDANGARARRGADSPTACKNGKESPFSVGLLPPALRINRFGDQRPPLQIAAPVFSHLLTPRATAFHFAGPRHNYLLGAGKKCSPRGRKAPGVSETNARRFRWLPPLRQLHCWAYSPGTQRLLPEKTRKAIGRSLPIVHCRCLPGSAKQR